MEGLQAGKPERAAQPPPPSLEQAAERYAWAWTDADRMQEQALPILEYQKCELKEAATSLEAVRPNAVNDLHNALRFEPATWQAMTQLSGSARGAELAGAIRHEDKVRRDPSLKAERLVKEWKGLETRHDKLRDNYLDRAARDKLEGRMKGIACELKRDPQLESLVRVRAKALGIDMDSRLRRVLEAPTIGMALHEIGRGRNRGLSR